MNKKIKSKISSKKSTISFMINLYCKNHHNSQNNPCKSCKELIAYSHEKIEKCPNLDSDLTCGNCEIHCYNQEMQQEIRKIMKYSGPRMIFHQPITAIKHLIKTKLTIE